MNRPREGQETEGEMKKSDIAFGVKQFIMEKRTADGTLDLSNPQPPFLICTENQIFDHYFRTAQLPAEQTSATQESVREWYKAQGFVWRPKTW